MAECLSQSPLLGYVAQQQRSILEVAISRHHTRAFSLMHWIVSTLSKNHIDYGKAINQLKGCIYCSDQDDENAVRLVLKDGLYNGTIYSDADIDEMKKENKSWKRFKDYIRIWLYPASMITSHLDSWFANFKATASPGQRAAGGRVDPRTKKPLLLKIPRAHSKIGSRQ
jgi:hypothetical protein